MKKVFKLLSVGIIATLLAVVAINFIGVNDAKAEGEHTVTFTFDPNEGFPGEIGITSGGTLDGLVATVDNGNTLIFTVKANSGYRFEGAKLDSNENFMDHSEEDDVYTFEIASIENDHAVTLFFIEIFKVTFTSNPEGVGEAVIDEAVVTEIEVEAGELKFSVNILYEHYKLTDILVWVEKEGGEEGQESHSIYETLEGEEYKVDITEDCEVALLFDKLPTVTFVLDPLEGGHVEINGEAATSEEIIRGEDLEFTVVPNKNYRIESVKVDGNPVELDENNTYLYEGIGEGGENVIVTIIFKKKSSGSRSGSSHDSDLPTMIPQTPSSGLLLGKPIGEMTQKEIRAKLIEVMKLLLTKLEQLLVLMQQQS